MNTSIQLDNSEREKIHNLFFFLQDYFCFVYYISVFQQFSYRLKFQVVNALEKKKKKISEKPLTEYLFPMTQITFNEQIYQPVLRYRIV